MLELSLLLIAGFVALSFTPEAMAQTSLGTISGTVRDTSDAVVTQASVTLTNEATGESRVTSTGNEGTYRADAVQPGPYTIRVVKAGFTTREINHLQVYPTVITGYDVQLKVAGAQSEMVVEAATTATLDLDSGGIATTITPTELKTVPIFSLNPIELAITLPGVELVNNGGEGNGFEISVNGARSRSNNYLMDGQDDNDNDIAGQALQPQIPDMFSSVSVQTNSYSAEFGRAGGAVVNLVTKSGTNELHGSGWDLYSGSGLNAVDGLSRGPGFVKTRFDQHQFGFTAGGPIIRNKLFAFGAAQWTRFYGAATPNPISLPTDQDVVTLTDGSTTNTYAYLKSLAAGGNTHAALLLQYIGPLSQYLYDGSTKTAVKIVSETNCTSCNLRFDTYRRPSQASLQSDTQWTAKADYDLTSRDHFTGRFLHDYGNLQPDWFNFASQLPGFDSGQGGPPWQSFFGYTHVFSPTTLNEFRGSLTRIDFEFFELPATIANPLYKMPVINIANTGLPQLGPQSTSLPQGRGHDFYQFQDTLTKTFGHNTLRVGADAARAIVRDFIPFNNFGSLSYAKSSGYTALNNFLDDFLGSSGSASISFGGNRVDSHQWQTAFFGQDDIKLTPDLTANLGLRWEFQTNPENAVKYPAINPATVLTDPIATVYRVREDKNNFGPRIGFAYNPHGGVKFLGDGKTVYHAGFGIFYDVLFMNITDNSQETAPNVQSPQVSVATGRGAPNASTIVPGMTPGPIGPTNTEELTTNNLVNPMTYQWNFGIERELPGQVKFSATYVGTRGSKLFINQQYNYFVNGTRVNPARGPIIARGNFAASEYNGLQIGASHDMRHGLFLQASYTYSKNLDDGSEVFTLFASPTSYSANLAPGHRGQEWGPSAYDFRQYLSLAYTWSIPNIPHLSNAGANEIVDIGARGWQFSAVNAWQSGQYSTFNLSGFDFNLDGSSANDRPLVGNPQKGLETIGMDGSVLGCTAAPGEGLFDYGANDVSGACNPVTPADVHWVVPYPYTQANMSQEIGRNSFRNPGYWNMNAALQKSFALHIPRMENSALQIRGEAQNLFNHNNVGPLQIDLLDAAPGPGDPFMNTSAARFDDERQLRIWAKFVF
jgi:outer membrane receptor protein involved in Fe transport